MKKDIIEYVSTFIGQNLRKQNIFKHSFTKIDFGGICLDILSGKQTTFSRLWSYEATSRAHEFITRAFWSVSEYLDKNSEILSQ